MHDNPLQHSATHGINQCPVLSWLSFIFLWHSTSIKFQNSLYVYISWTSQRHVYSAIWNMKSNQISLTSFFFCNLPCITDFPYGQIVLLRQLLHLGPTGRHVCWPNPTKSMLRTSHSSLKHKKSLLIVRWHFWGCTSCNSPIN